MAYTLDHVPSTGFFTRFVEAIVAIGEKSARGQLAREIAAMTDEEFKALGTTRAEFVQRTLGAGYF